MDPGVLALMIPIVAIVGGISMKILRGPIGEAIAHRLSGGASDSPAIRAELDAMHQEVETLRQELADAQERIDFTERLLAKGRETELESKG